MSKHFHMAVLGAVLSLALPVAHAAEQPHMHEALRALMAARHQLEMAAPNKGGHRARAIEQIDASIASVRAGIRFADHH